MKFLSSSLVWWGFFVYICQKLEIMKMSKEEIKTHLVKAGVKNLKEFGYNYVTSENILTDEVYKMFFKSMLEDNLGSNDLIDQVINELLLEVGSNR